MKTNKWIERCRRCARVTPALLAGALLADTPTIELTHEHVDIRMVYQPDNTNLLALHVRDSDLNRAKIGDAMETRLHALLEARSPPERAGNLRRDSFQFTS